jgi:hypothetical protein
MLYGLILLIPLFAYFGGAISIQYYVKIRTPDRIALDEFSKHLPRLLQSLYFNPENSAPYLTSTKHSTIDYLLSAPTKPQWLLIGWLVHLMLFVWYFNVRLVLLLDASLINTPEYFCLLCGVIMLYARIAFFGSRIRRGASVTFHD